VTEKESFRRANLSNSSSRSFAKIKGQYPYEHINSVEMLDIPLTDLRREHFDSQLPHKITNVVAASWLWLWLWLWLLLFNTPARGSLLPAGMPPRFGGLSPRSLAQTAGSSLSPSRAVVPRLRVVTDIDDTVKSSGGLNILGIALGGIDVQFKRGEFYPGVFQFLLELSKGMSVSKSFCPEKVAVLTARAREFKFALALKPKDKLCTAFREVGKRNGFLNWGIGPVYYGSVAEWILQERKGLRKFVNFEKMMRDDAMCSGRGAKKYILVGDTGEKDEDAGERIIAKYPRAVAAVFLHVVSKEKDRSRVVLPRDRQINGVPILYFRTYVGAAQKAMQTNLITQDGLMRVIKAARQDLLSKSTGKLLPRPVASQAAELEQDIASAISAKENRFRLSFRVDRQLG